jgi:spoIIIJ-associated protein
VTDPAPSGVQDDTRAAEALREAVEAVMEALGVEGELVVGPGEEDGLVAEVLGTPEDVAPMVGPDGQTLDAVQYIAGQIVRRADEGSRRRVAVDAGGYRERRARTLERLAERAAAEALEHSEEIELDAMSPHDRRIVHMALKDRDDVVTRSEGDEPRRRIVVAPADLDADD